MFINNQCTIHKAKEEFLCIKKECQEQQRSLSCYICLSQNHIQPNHVPQEHFKSINSLFEKINENKIKKLNLLDKTKSLCHKQKKETMQEIEKYPFYNSYYHQDLIRQIENQINQLSTYVEAKISLFQQVFEQKVENLEQIIELSNQNYQCLENIIDQKRKDTQTKVKQLQSRIENNIYETLKSYETKFQVIENKFEVIEKKMNKSNSWVSKVLAFIILVLALNIQQIYQNQNVQIPINYDLIDLSNKYQNWRITIKNKIEELESALNLINIQQNQLVKMLNTTTKNKIQKIEDNIQNFSLQFETNKKHLQYLNNISQSEILYNYALKEYVGKIHVQMDVFKLKDFEVIYKQKLIQPFNWIDELQILRQVRKDRILCLGGQINTDPDHLLVVACDYASEIFEDTEDIYRARKSKQGDIYWYKVDQYSIGFSPKADITLQLCDDFEPNDQRRFSIWYNHGKDGGRRIGNRSDLNNSEIHEMIIYAL